MRDWKKVYVMGNMVIDVSIFRDSIAFDFFSYGVCVFQFDVNRQTGAIDGLIDCKSYSRTTQKHKGIAMGILKSCTAYGVDSVISILDNKGLKKAVYKGDELNEMRKMFKVYSINDERFQRFFKI